MVSTVSLCETLEVLNPCSHNWTVFLFFLIVFFLSRNHLPRGSVCISVSCVKLSSGAFNHSFRSIAFAECQRNNDINVRKKQRKLSLNRTAEEEHKYFPYNEKIVIPSASRARKYLTWHAASDCKTALHGACLKPGDSYMKRSGMFVVSGINQNGLI